MKKLIVLLVVMLLTEWSAGFMPVYKKGAVNEGHWQWLTENNFRVVMQPQKLPQDIGEHKIAWTRLNFDYAYDSGMIEGLINYDSVRVIAYDKATGKPLRYTPGNSQSLSAYLVPAKIDDWGYRGDSYRILRYRQLSWIRKDNDENLLYICYFDVHGSGETDIITKPAFIGAGDALAFGGSGKTEYLRGAPIVYDWNGNGHKDIITYCGSMPEVAVYVVLNDGNMNLEATLPKPIEIGGHLGNAYKQVDDINGDGKLDIVIVGRYFRDIENSGLSDFVNIDYPENSTLVDEFLPDCRTVSWHLADWDGDGKKDLMLAAGWWGDYGWDDAYDSEGNWTNGPLRGWFYFFKNNGTNDNFNLAQPIQLKHIDDTNIEVYGRPNPIFVDLNGNGMLDLITSEFTGDIYVYLNVGTPGSPQLGDKQKLATVNGDFEGDYQALTLHLVDWNDNGYLDIFLQGENKRAGYMENTGTFTASGVPIYEEVVYLRTQSQYPNSAMLAVGDLYDWTGNGKLDLIYGDSAGYIGWYEAIGSYPNLSFDEGRLFTNGGEPIRIVAGENGSIQGPAEKRWGYTVPVVGDWDMDGYPDIMLNSIWGNIVWYQNPGIYGTSELDIQRNVEVQWLSTPPKPAWQWWDPQPNQWATQWRSTVQLLDYDNNGLLDVVALDYEGYLVLHRRYLDGSIPLLGAGERIFLDNNSQPWQINPSTAGRSGRRKFRLTDWNNNGKWDLIVDNAGYGSNVALYENIGDNINPVFVLSGALADIIVAGHTSSPIIFDLENNGVKDLILAAEDGHFYCFHRSYIENRMTLQASFVAEQGLVYPSNDIVLFRDSIVNGEVSGALRTRGASYLGQWLLYVENSGYQDHQVVLDFQENINIKENTVLKAAFKFATDATFTSTELARIDVRAVCADTLETVSYLPANSIYTISGVQQQEQLVFNDDPSRWQELTLDLTSGDGLPATGMLNESTVINRIVFVFNQPVAANIDYVRISQNPSIYQTTCAYYLSGDLNNDCAVDLLDVSIMANNWLVE